MSTGAECFFQEKERGKWFYSLQRWPYGEWPEFDEFGPFPTFKAAQKHLDRHHRVVEVIRDYGMFARTEAPQHFPA